jgi:hypothetical protein
MTTATEALTVHAARDRYLRDNGFDPSYAERWVKLKAGPIPIWFPNAPGRVRAVKRHDLHHVATGYDTTWTGEAEIAAWELASGCGRFAWAWGLNLSALPIGLLIAPRAIFAAFVRGRHSTNLYRRRADIDDALLAQTVCALRAQLGLARPTPRARPADVARFAACCAAAASHMLAGPALLLAWWW